MTEFRLMEDRDASDAEIARARALFGKGEMTEETFAWLMGMIDLKEDIPWHMMTKAQKRSYFAKQKAEKLSGDLFGTRRMRKARKIKKRIVVCEAWIDGKTEASNEGHEVP